MMERIDFGKTGERVSPVSLGCMLMGTTIGKEESFAILDDFLARGGNFLDTANCYAWWVGHGEFVGDESETVLGEWMKSRRSRERVFLATKAGARLRDPAAIRDSEGLVYWDRVDEAREFLSAPNMRAAVEGSLRRLQTDRIDLYYAHIDDRRTPLEETLGVFADLVREGKVRYIAASNLRTWRLERARRISAANGWPLYVAIQQQYSYLRPKPGADFGVAVNVDGELLDYLAANGDLMLLAYSPLLKGIYDDRAKREAYYNWEKFRGDDADARLAALAKLSGELGVTNSNLVLAWLLHQPRVIPILGFSRIEQYRENMKALDVRLGFAQLERLNRASG
jgi:aryl-alcohol dehydrogenase-like predicted oxidoreductase